MVTDILLAISLTTSGLAQLDAATDDVTNAAPLQEPDAEAMAEAARVRDAFESHDRTMLDADILETFYNARQWQPAFITPDGPTWEGLILLEQLPDGVRHGIDPDWLGLDDIRRSFREVDSGGPDSATAAAALEVELADALVRLGRELRYDNAANTPPGQSHSTWRTNQLLALLATHGSDLSTALVELAPTLPSYHNLLGALNRYRAIQEAGAWPELSETLDESASEESLEPLRERLAIEGYLEEGTKGPWDDSLRAALARYQDAHHIDDEHLVDDDTLESLNVPVQQRVASIIVSLDRMRNSHRGSDGQGEAVWVNVAGFYVEVWEDDERLFRTRAVVGRTSGGSENHTPLFSDEMERIELNPTWYPPPRLAENLRLDRSRGIVRQNGRIVQLPGPNNALGRVKFLFPNHHDVYLHDTSHRELFDETIRAYSSGCVRIDRPLELATLLISRDQDRDFAETQAWIDEIMATTNTEVVNLNRHLPVHIEYYTAYVADDGIVEFYGDIYDLDRRAVRELSRRRDVSWEL
jgi:murein L,D-transpeptidase YcbB/YkuD